MYLLQLILQCILPDKKDKQFPGNPNYIWFQLPHQKRKNKAKLSSIHLELLKEENLTVAGKFELQSIIIICEAESKSHTGNKLKYGKTNRRSPLPVVELHRHT